MDTQVLTTCPVCGQENHNAGLMGFSCTACGFNNAHIRWFSSSESYDRWMEEVRKARKERAPSLVGSLALGIGSAAFLSPESQTLTVVFWNGETLEFKDALQYSCSETGAVVLKRDGSVIAYGQDNSQGQMNVQSWRDVCCILRGEYCTYGVCKSGDVLVAGLPSYAKVNTWRDIRHLAMEPDMLLGVQQNGHVTLAWKNGMNASPLIQEAVAQWHDVATAVVSHNCCAALHKDGTVSVAAANDDPRLNASVWTQVQQLEADDSYLVGLRKDGSVLLAGSCRRFWDRGRSDAASWQHVLAISCSQKAIAAITEQGELLVAGSMPGDVEQLKQQWAKVIKPKIQKLI